MAFKIKGFVKVQTHIKVGSRYVGVKIKFKNSNTEFIPDSSGNTTVPILLQKYQIDAMFKDLPVSQFGKLDGLNLAFTISGKIINFTQMNPLFIAGQYFELSARTLDTTSLNSINGTIYIYVQLKLGIPQYTASLVQIPETVTSMFIGTVTTNSTGNIITSALSKVSRFDKFRASVTQIGSGIPVSTGNPTQTGTINW